MSVLKRFAVGLVAVLYFSTAFADGLLPGDGIPKLPNNLKCLNKNGQALAYNNSSVMKWRQTTDNSYHDRGFVQGQITDVYPSKKNSKGFTHTHFAIDLDKKTGGEIELIFNDEFGPLPHLSVGMLVSACGDYITANAQSDLPSPMGAIIHWVHYNPGNRDGGAHKDGFLVIESAPYGFTTPTGEVSRASRKKPRY